MSKFDRTPLSAQINNDINSIRSSINTIKIGQIAILGNSQGQIYVTPRSDVPADESTRSQYYARWIDGIDEDGNVVPASEFTVFAGGDINPEIGVPIVVEPIPGDPNNYRIAGYALEILHQAGKNISQYTSGYQSRRDTWFRDIWDGKIIPALDTDNNSYTTSIKSYGYEYWAHDGTLRTLRKGVSSALDLVDAIPSAGNELYVLIYQDSTDGTINYVSTDATAITPDKPTFSNTLQPLLNKVPHQLCIIQEVWRLAHNQNRVTQNDFRADLRQMIDVPKPQSFPTTITRNFLIPDNHEQIVTKQIDIDDGSNLLLGDGVELINITDTNALGSAKLPAQVRTIRTITSSDSLVLTDGTLLVDCSGGAVTVTLMAASTAKGRQFNIKLIDATGGALTVDGNSSETIDDATTQTLTTQYDSISIVSDGTEWWIV